MSGIFHGMYIVDLEDKIQAKDALIAALEKIVEVAKNELNNLATGPINPCQTADRGLQKIILMEKEIGK